MNPPIERCKLHARSVVVIVGILVFIDFIIVIVCETVVVIRIGVRIVIAVLIVFIVKKVPLVLV